MLGLRGSVAPEAGFFDSAAREIKSLLDDAGVGDQPVGIDIVELPMLFALQRLGVDVRDGQQVMLNARAIKSSDEIMLLSTSAAMVDGAYQLIRGGSRHVLPAIRCRDGLRNWFGLLPLLPPWCSEREDVSRDAPPDRRDIAP